MIVKAAVRVMDKIYTGRRHGEAIHAAAEAAAAEAGEWLPITSKMQGFVDDTGRFLGRKAARVHAERCGQITFKKDRVGKPLISEELW